MPKTFSLPLSLGSSAVSVPGLVFLSLSLCVSVSLSLPCFVSSPTQSLFPSMSHPVPSLSLRRLPPFLCPSLSLTLSPLSLLVPISSPNFLKSMFHLFLHLPLAPVSNSPFSSISHPCLHLCTCICLVPFSSCLRLCRLSLSTAPSQAPSLPWPCLHPPPGLPPASPPGCNLAGGGAEGLDQNNSVIWTN